MILPPAWMTDARTARVMQAIGGYRAQPESLFVGGCVRNLLLGKPVADIDIATVHRPLETIEKLKAAGIRYVPTGLEHGTVTAIVDDAVFEITTLRKDLETDGRHAVIAFATEWVEDARRRDFTMNALYAAPDGNIFDPLGTGLDDAQARRVVFVGNAEERIAEDYLRILRFFRFWAQYGEGPADAAALKACARFADKIEVLSRERVTQEFLKILNEPNAAATLSLMFAHGVLADMKKGFKQIAFEHFCMLQEKFESRNVLARLPCLSAFKVEFFEDRILLSNIQKKTIEMVVAALPLVAKNGRKKAREAVYRFGNAIAVQAYFLHLSKRQESPDLDLLDILRYWHAPVFPLNGADLLKQGASPGPALGKKLKSLEEKWIARDFPAQVEIK